jgi:hypothetical protein
MLQFAQPIKLENITFDKTIMLDKVLRFVAETDQVCPATFSFATWLTTHHLC